MSPTGLSPNVLGSLYMAIGSLGYEGLDVYQALFLRGVAISTLFAAAGEVRGQRLAREQLRRPPVVRVVAELAAIALFFAAVAQMPFAVTVVTGNISASASTRSGTPR